MLALGLALGSIARWGFLRLADPSLSRYPIRGIDVSHHQGRIDWSAVRDAEIRFAFLKASEGRDHRDPRFHENWLEAGEAGLARGAYHFFTFCRPGADQAANFLEALAGRELELPPAADVEFAGNCEGWSSIADIRVQLQIFLDLVEEGFGSRPVLYLTRESRSRLAAGTFAGYDRWARGVVLEPSRRRWGHWVFWQYSDEARVDGIRGPVDMNVFHGGEADFVALTSTVRANRPPPRPPVPPEVTAGHTHGS